MGSGAVHLLALGGGQRLVGVGRLVLQAEQGAQMFFGSLVRRFQQSDGFAVRPAGRMHAEPDAADDVGSGDTGVHEQITRRVGHVVFQMLSGVEEFDRLGQAPRSDSGIALTRLRHQALLAAAALPSGRSCLLSQARVPATVRPCLATSLSSGSPAAAAARSSSSVYSTTRPSLPVHAVTDRASSLTCCSHTSGYRWRPSFSGSEARTRNRSMSLPRVIRPVAADPNTAAYLSASPHPSTCAWRRSSNVAVSRDSARIGSAARCSVLSR